MNTIGELRAFVGFDDQDLERVRSARPLMEPHLDAMTARIREQLLAHATGRHFSGDRERVGVHVRATIERMLDAERLDDLEGLLDVRAAHPGVPAREMVALCGYLADDVTQLIWSLRLPAARKHAAIRSFQKLFWLQAAVLSGQGQLERP